MATLFELAARLQAAGAAEGMLLIVVKATLILIIARILLAVMPHASAATKHLIATAALVAIGLMPVLSVIVPVWEIAAIQESVPEPAATPTPTPTPTVNDGGLKPAAPQPTNNRTVDAAISAVRSTGVLPEEPLTAAERAINVGRATWKGLIVVFLAGVSLLMLASMTIGMLGVWFVSRSAEELTHDNALLELDQARDQLALPFEVRLLRSSRISVPVIWGVTRPVLLLPADVVTWPSDRLRVVMLHELAHLKRFDGISLILTRIAVSLFWFHPLAWSLERAGRSECERACDDLVLAGGTKPSEYADHLLAIARSMPTFDPFRSVTLAMSRKSQLEGRLLSILQPHVARRVFSGRGVAIACALAVAVIAPVAAMRLVAAPPDGKDVLAKQQAEKKDHEIESDSEVTVKGDLDAIEDYFYTKLGKYDKRADKWARQPKNGEEWYERAYDYYHAERFEEAATAFKRAADEDYREETSLYNAACSYALLGDANRALIELDLALRAGWDDIEKIGEDSDFDPIRSDPRFARLVSERHREEVTRRVDETVQRYEDLKEGRSDKHTVEKKIQEVIEHGIGGALGKKIRFGDEEWFEVGLDLLRLRRLDESIDAFQRSIAANEKNATAMYNIACAYSLKNDARNGMVWLDKAIEEGFSGDEKLENDPDIALLRKESGFDSLRERAKHLEMKGCCSEDGDSWVDKLAPTSWREATQYHRKIADRYPNSGRAHFNLGFTSIRAKDYATAHREFRRAIELGHRVGTSSYNIACAYALQGDNNAAFEWLERAQNHGFELEDHIGGDDDLENLHDDPRWDKLCDELDVETHGKKHRKNDD